MGAKTLGIYLITTITGVSMGLLLVNIIKPGKFVDEDTRIKNRLSYEAWAMAEGIEIKDGQFFTGDAQYSEFLTEAQQAASQLSEDPNAKLKLQTAKEAKEDGPLQFLINMVPENIILSISDNGLMLQVIFFAIFFGICVAILPEEKVSSVKNFARGTNDVFLKMVDFIMQAAPFFVFALMAGVLSQMADTPAEVFEIFKGLGTYTITVLIGLLFMIFVFYPFIVKSIVKSIKYREFFKRISPAQFLAFSTSSSAAT